MRQGGVFLLYFNGFTAEKAATFLNTVYTPVFTTSE